MKTVLITGCSSGFGLEIASFFLAQGWKVLRPIAAGQPVRWSDVAFDASSTAVRVRREMEQTFAPQRAAA